MDSVRACLFPILSADSMDSIIRYCSADYAAAGISSYFFPSDLSACDPVHPYQTAS